MSSEFLIAAARELPKQNNMVNKAIEGKMIDEDYTNNQLKEKLSMAVPEFSCIKNFSFNKNMIFCGTPVPNCTATRKHSLDNELDTRLPKLIKLQPEYTNYRSESAVDMVDAVRAQVIKNDVILGENLENPSINKNEKSNVLIEETSHQQLAHDTLDTCSSDHISMEAIGDHCCATIDNISHTDREATDQEQNMLKMEMEMERAALQIQNRNDSSASLVMGEDCVTETENLLLNTEKHAFYAHEFVGAETVADEYQSVHESFSLSEFLICPTNFEQKESYDTLLHPVQEEVVCGTSATAASDTSPTVENKFLQYESEMSGHACTSFDLGNKLVGKDECDSIAHPLGEAQKLPHSAEEGISSNLLPDKIRDNEVITRNQAVVVEEFLIKQEIEDSTLPAIHVPSVDLLHNRELDLADDSVFQNWFMSLVTQEATTESVSTSTYGRRESSDKGNTEDICRRTAYQENLASALAKSAAAKEYSVEPRTKFGNEIVGKDMAPLEIIGQSGHVQIENHYAERTHNSNEEKYIPGCLHLIPSAPFQTHTHKVEASVENVKHTFKDLFSGLSAPTLPRSVDVQLPTTNLQPLENKSDLAATTESDVENTAKPEFDIIHKHHKKELIKKFSSGLTEDGKYGLNNSQGTVIQTEVTMKDAAVPSTSTSTAITNEDKCIKDCIVISDSDDDSIIEFDIVKTCTKKRVKKSVHCGLLGKNTQSNSRKSNTRSSANEESLGQQARNSTIKSSAILECIVVSDSDDESSKPALSSRNRTSNRSDEGASISDAESHVSFRDTSPRNRTESHGVIDLSGGRSPFALSKNNSAVTSAGDNIVGTLAIALAAGDSQSSLVDRLGSHNSALDSNSTNPFISTFTAACNLHKTNLVRESNGGDVIDLSRRNLTPSITSLQNKTNSAVDVLDLSGNDKKQQERHSVIKTVGTASENKSATKEVAEEKDSSPAWSCPICFESLLSGQQSVSSTPCGHVFCTKCIEEAVNQFKKCPTCCRKVALKRVHKIFL